MVLLVLSAAVPPAEAAVLKTIAVDGDMADWTDVLADPYQTAYDGPAQGLADLDASVPSVGRDLTAFAWTYDTTYLYFYVGRVGNQKNRQRFWFYADTNGDRLLQSGEPVVGVSWWGSSGSTTTAFYSYRAVSPGGDPMDDASGLADGWTMPGTVSLVGTLESGHGGAATGVQMEARVSWASLGTSPGSPVFFHVSSSNSTNLPAQVHDNMGGPGGRIGFIGVAGVLLEPDRTGTVVPAGISILPHQATNNGGGTDVLNLTWSASGDFMPASVAYYRDTDGDGKLGPLDPVLVDTDGDGNPDTGPVPAGVSVQILAVVTAPAGVAEGNTCTVVHTASSSNLPSVTDAATDTITVARPDMTLVKSVNASTGGPGDVLTYTIAYTSTGNTDAYAVVVLDAVPPETAYVQGSATGAGTTIEFSHDGGASFSATDAPPVTHIRWIRTSALAPGDGGSVAFQAAIR